MVHVFEILIMMLYAYQKKTWLYQTQPARFGKAKLTMRTGFSKTRGLHPERPGEDEFG